MNAHSVIPQMNNQCSTVGGMVGGITKGRVETQANLVRKQWKCVHLECSAKYNWRVTAVFRELMKAVDHAALSTGHHGHNSTSHRVQEALRIEKCVIL